MVADISINDNKKIRSVRIPILLTINSFGDYNGDIKMVQDITYDSDGIVNRDVYNLNANNYFTILPYYITFVVKDEELDSIKDERTRTVAKAIVGSDFWDLSIGVFTTVGWFSFWSLSIVVWAIGVSGVENSGS